MKSLRLLTLFGLTMGMAVVCVRAQNDDGFVSAEDEPVTEAVGIWAEHSCNPWETSVLEVSVAGYSGRSESWWNSQWAEMGQFHAQLRPGMTYQVVVYGEYVDEYRIRFNLPNGYRAYVDNIEQRSFLSDGTLDFSNRVFNLRIEGGVAKSHMSAGVCTNLDATSRIVWCAGLGDLSNGLPAGSVAFREDGFSANLGSRASLFYDSSCTEVQVIKVPWTGELRQVNAPQALMDIVDLPGGGIGLDCYMQDYFPWTGDAYDVSGKTPFARFELHRLSGDELQINKVVGSKVWYTRLTRSTNGSDETYTLIDWTENLNAPARVEECVVSQAGGVHEVTVRDGSGNIASVTRREYGMQTWGRELTKHIAGYGTENLTTTYTYCNAWDEGWEGDYGKLSTVTRPDGSYEAYAYYDDPDRRGMLMWKVEPFLDDAGGRQTIYDYSADHTGARTRPWTAEEWTLGVLTGKRITTYEDNYFYVNNSLYYQPIVTATTTDYADPTKTKVTKHTYFREDADLVAHWLTEMPLATETAGGQKLGYAYERGWFNPSLRVFTPNPGDVHVQEIIIHGSATQTPGSIPVSSYGAASFPTVYVVPGKSTMEMNIRGTSGVIYYAASCIADASGNFVRTNGLLMPHLEGRWKLYEWDDYYRYHNEWTWANGQLTQHTDADGAVTSFEYDSAGRLFRETRQAAAASGSFPAMPAIPVEYEYDAESRPRFRREGPSAQTAAVFEWRYDRAGRRTYAREPGSDAVLISYPSATQVKYELPGPIQGAAAGTKREVIEDHYRDRSLKTRSGNAAVPLYATVDLDGTNPLNGKLTRKSALDSGYTSMLARAELDWLGRPVRELAPTWAGGTRQVDTTYCGCGRLERVAVSSAGTRLSPPQLFLYDAMGQLSWRVSDYDDNGAGDMLTRDATQKVDTSFASLEGAWWLVEKAWALPTEGSSAERLVSETRTKLTGLSSTTAAVVKSIDGPGNVTTVTTTIDRAAKRRTVTVDRPDATADETIVHINGLLHRTESAGGVVETRTYDGHGRLTLAQGRSSVQAWFTYMPGTYLVYQKLNCFFPTDTYAYDAAGRVASHTDARGKVDYFGYDAAGRLTHRWGATVQPMQIGYDTAGRRTDLWTWSDGSGWDAVTGASTGSGWTGSTWPNTAGLTIRHTSWTYQPATGLLVTKTDPSGHEVTYQYNARDQVSKRTEARSASETIVTDYSYWEAGATDPGYTVHPSGALRRVDYNHANTTDLVYRYDRLGRLARVTDATGDRTFAYQDTDPAAGVGPNLQVTAETFAGGFYGSTFSTLTRSYDTATIKGRYTGFTAGGGLGQGYQFGAASGRLDRITATGFTDQVYGYEGGSDFVQSVTAGSWVHRNYWQGWRDMLDGNDHRWNGSNRAMHMSDTDWGARRLNSKLTGDLAAKLGSAYANGIWTDFSYTDRNEVYYSDSFKMTSGGAIEYSGGVPVAVPNRYLAERFDVAANPTQKNLGGNGFGFSRNNLDQFTAVTGAEQYSISHDQAGNMTADAAWYYDYDGENRLWRIRPKSEGSPWRYTYDYLGRRVMKEKRNTADTASIETTRFVYDGWNLIAELDGSNAVQRSYTWGLDASATLGGAGGVGGLLAFKDHAASKVYYPIYDASHNIVGWGDSAANGAVVAAYAYTPFGERLQAVEDAGIAGKARFGFSTKYTDQETGLVYYGLRFYSPKLGRFINRDPIEEAGGINLYSLAGNDPVNRWDHLGLDDETVTLTDFVINGGRRAIEAGLSSFMGGVNFLINTSFAGVNLVDPTSDTRSSDPNNGSENKPPERTKPRDPNAELRSLCQSLIYQIKDIQIRQMELQRDAERADKMVSGLEYSYSQEQQWMNGTYQQASVGLANAVMELALASNHSQFGPAIEFAYSNTAGMGVNLAEAQNLRGADAAFKAVEMAFERALGLKSIITAYGEFGGSNPAIAVSSRVPWGAIAVLVAKTIDAYAPVVTERLVFNREKSATVAKYQQQANVARFLIGDYSRQLMRIGQDWAAKNCGSLKW